MKLAFVFPGQGSQSPGMMSALTGRFEVVRDTFEQASEIIGTDLWSLAQDGPADELNRTQVTQPVMLCAGVATWRCVQAAGGPVPEFLAGHSLGEYTALVCAGSISFADAVSLVEFRAQVMQEAVADGAGAMAAIIGLDDEAVIEACSGAAEGEIVEAVNFNAPGQVVIAGHRGAVARACDAAQQAGARRCIELPVSVPSHCGLMKGAAQRLADKLADTQILAPEIPVVHNADVGSHEDAGAIRDALVRQLHSPVRWVETIGWFKAQGVTRVVECGPGKVLAGLNRRIDRRMDVLALVDATVIDELAGASGEEA